MEITTDPAAAHRDQRPARRDFGTVKILLVAYGALSAVLLAAVTVLAVTGHAVTSFMWGRSAGVFASAVVTYWFAVLAARGARWAYVRVRVITMIAPVAIVAIDTIPGVLPAWFVVTQVLCALAIAGAAFLVNGPRLRAAFLRSR